MAVARELVVAPPRPHGNAQSRHMMSVDLLRLRLAEDRQRAQIRPDEWWEREANLRGGRVLAHGTWIEADRAYSVALLAVNGVTLPFALCLTQDGLHSVADWRKLIDLQDDLLFDVCRDEVHEALCDAGFHELAEAHDVKSMRVQDELTKMAVNDVLNLTWTPRMAARYVVATDLLHRGPKSALDWARR